MAPSQNEIDVSASLGRIEGKVDGIIQRLDSKDATCVIMENRVRHLEENSIEAKTLSKKIPCVDHAAKIKALEDSTAKKISIPCAIMEKRVGKLEKYAFAVGVAIIVIAVMYNNGILLKAIGLL